MRLIRKFPRIALAEMAVLVLALAACAASPTGDSIFEKPIASSQLIFLNDFAGNSSNDAARDGKVRKLIHNVVPDTPFHFGTDMPLPDAIQTVLSGPPFPVAIRDSRYVMISTSGGPNVRGRGFMWFDMQDGIGLGGIFYRPSNGEPTPTLTVFSKQVKEESIEMSQLPAAFFEDMNQWAAASLVPPIVTRYFINEEGAKILLVHDEDFCIHPEGVPAPSEEQCEQMNADAADIDMEAVYFLARTNYASNATARTAVDSDQQVWLKLRDDTCKVGPERLHCRIRLTRERVHVLIKPHPGPRPPSPPRHKGSPEA